MGKLFNVSSSPHVRSSHTTQAIMFDVAIAMLPASIYGVRRPWTELDEPGSGSKMLPAYFLCRKDDHIYRAFLRRSSQRNTDGHVKGRRAGGCDRYVYRTDSRNHR